MARSKVKSRSDHDVAHLHILTNVKGCGVKTVAPSHLGYDVLLK